MSGGREEKSEVRLGGGLGNRGVVARVGSDKVQMSNMREGGTE